MSPEIVGNKTSYTWVSLSSRPDVEQFVKDSIDRMVLDSKPLDQILVYYGSQSKEVASAHVAQIIGSANLSGSDKDSGITGCFAHQNPISPNFSIIMFAVNRDAGQKELGQLKETIKIANQNITALGGTKLIPQLK
jgi:hypothetical protein